MTAYNLAFFAGVRSSGVAVGTAIALGIGQLWAGLLQALLLGRQPALVTAAIFALAALLAVPLATVLAGAPVLTARDALIVGWLGVMSTGVAYLLLSHALRQVGGATAVGQALAEPVTAFVLALAVVGERPAPLAYVGLAAVLAGLAAVVRTELRDST